VPNWVPWPSHRQVVRAHHIAGPGRDLTLSEVAGTSHVALASASIHTGARMYWAERVAGRLVHDATDRSNLTG
jgi:hypothetical protein